jgi:primosomal replication protein N
METKSKVNINNVELSGKLLCTKVVWKTNEHTSYEGVLQVIRDSGYIDLIPILYSDTVICDGTTVLVQGQFRSRDIEVDGKLKVELYVFAKSICELTVGLDLPNINNISLTGFICKKPTLRTTPSGKQVSDLLIACNFGKDKTAYIPAVSWGKYARKSGKLLVGTEVAIQGRLQSRKYNKILDSENGIYEERIAYELSISTIDTTHHYEV